jgi:hypothetical protein
MDAHELKYFEEIERYLDGEMTDQERIQFEQRLIAEPLLKKEYDVLSAIVYEVGESKKRELKAMLQNVDEELDNVTPSNSVNKHKAIKKSLSEGRHFWNYAIAACVTLLVGISIIWLVNHADADREKLVAQYWQKDAGMPVMMGESDAVKFDNAMSEYKAGKYSEAFILFKQIPSSDTVVYYTALSMSELKQDATTQFKIVAKQQNSVFQDKAKYYLLLLHIKADKKTEAQNLLNDLLTNKNHPYYTFIEKLSSEAYFKE